MMDSTDFSRLIGRLEREADDNPQAYAARVALVAALGYATIAIVALAIAVACGFILLSLLSGQRVSITAVVACVACVATLMAIIRALWVRVDAPIGRDVTSEDAPELFAAIDDVIQRTTIRRKGKTCTVVVDAVTLDGEFNVSICQIPRWGVFGNYRNHLQIGIPLMAALSIAEFKAVLAHEIGHLGGRNGRFAAWIYRQRITWGVLQRRFAEPASLFEQLLATFYRRYTPYFLACTFALARQHEYAADRIAARATNARVLARALTKLELMGRFLVDVFWQRLFAQVEKVPEPQYLPYAMMPRAFMVAQKEWQRQDWLRQSLRRFAAHDDTHPSLGERLAALDVTPELPAATPEKTALSLFGANATAMLQWCDEEWRRENVPAWRKRHEAIREMRWKVSQYESAPAGELKPEDHLAKALLLLDLGDDAAAVEELQTLVTLEPSLAKGHFLLGRLLLGSGDEHGLAHLGLAVQHDEELLESAGGIGYTYLMDRGRKGEAQRFWERVRAA
jgi:hypothetical protein